MNPLILRGDARKIPLPDESVSAIVTDPPYELKFMNKRWDGAGVSFDPATWAESLRVLKPGGHLLAFAGTRTSHRIAVAIEDAGFEIRDSLMWIYGVGFPKSLDISKAIDKMAGAERKVVGPKRLPDGRPASDVRGEGSSIRHEGYRRPWRDDPEAVERNLSITEPATDDARQWQGWGTALKPSHEPVIIARKPFAGNVASNVLAYGTGGINVDAGRIAGAGWSKSDGEQGAGFKTGKFMGGAGIGAPTQVNGERSNDLGRWPPNTSLQHNSDCRLVGVRRAKGTNPIGPNPGKLGYHGSDRSEPTSDYTDPDGLETVEVWECSDGCPVKQIDIQSGDVRGATSNGKKAGTGFREGWGEMGQAPGYADSGGCSRFFPRFAWDDDDWFPYLYCGKASRAERNAGCDALPVEKSGVMQDDNYRWEYDGKGNKINLDTRSANTHNTVKPVRFMEWLIRLVTPPGGVLLDPFAGSGSTLVAAVRCGVTAIGLDNDREHGYHAIQAARVRHAVENARPEAAFPTAATGDVLPIPPIKSRGRKRKHADGPTLFD
jgi:DNA modification methylase